MTPRDRKALLWGGGILVGAWLGLVGAQRLHGGWRVARDRVETERVLLLETRRSLEDLPAMEDSTRILTAKVAAMAPRILSGSTTAVALSDLSGRISTLLSLCHGRMVRFEAVPDSASAGQLRQVTATVALETDFRGLAETLEHLARDPLVTVVERLQVTPSDPVASPATVERLSIELRVTAWYLARGERS